MLTQIARALAGTGSNLPASLDILVNGAVTLLTAEGAIAARIADGAFRVDAAAGSLAPMLGFHAPVAGSLAADALAHEHAIVLNHAAGDPRVDAHFLGAFEPRQLVVAPMIVEHESRGFLLAINAVADKFTHADAALLQRLADHGAIAVRHTELFERAEQGVREAHSLSEVVQQVNQSLELERVVTLMARHAAALLGARGARLAVLDNGRLITSAVAGDATDTIGGSVDLNAVLAGEAIRNRRAVRTTDLRRYADQWARTGKGASLGEGRANGTAAPLLVGGRAIGAITVFGNEARDFAEHDEALLLALANHAAIAIENARLYRAAAHTARHASILGAAARALAFHTEPESVYDALAALVRDSLLADGFSIVVADAETRHVELEHTSGVGAGLVKLAWDHFWDTPGGRVVTTGEALYASRAEDAMAGVREEAALELRASQVRSLALVPLMGEGKPRGVLTLRFTTRRRFDEHERRLLEDFATQVAVALRNAQLTAAERTAREREKTLTEAMHQTEKLAALGELVAGVAHELNNPLTGISTFAQLLLEDSLSEDQLESVRTIKRESDRAVAVIRDLLLFSRKTGPRQVTVDLNAVVQQTLRLRTYALQSAGIEVRTELDPELPPIAGDDQKLQQVVLNLIVNAEYAMHRAEARRLSVRTTRRPFAASHVVAQTGNGGTRPTPVHESAARETSAGTGAVRQAAVIEVSDTGSGMPADVVKHVFEPFFTTKPAGVGTGLGLSVSYGIIQAHGGSIDVRSTPGFGTTFVITIPLPVPASRPASTPDAVSLPSPATHAN